jgi:hypothetical protein
MGYPTTNVNLPIAGAGGDSITAGQNDGINADSGVVAIACSGLGIPYYNIGTPGDTEANFSTSHTLRFAAMLVAAGSTSRVIFFDNYGRNDNPQTAADIATFKANRKAVHDALHTLLPGRVTVIGTTYTPKSSSTDSFETDANQTVVDVGRQAVILSMRTDPTGWGSDEPIIEVGEQAESVAGSGKWASNGSANWGVESTGIHPSGVIYQRMAYPIRQRLLRELILTPIPSITAQTSTTFSLSGTSTGGYCWVNYAWTCTTKPSGATVTFDNSTSQTPTATYDKPGLYVFTLTCVDVSLNPVAATLSAYGGIQYTGSVASKITSVSDGAVFYAASQEPAAVDVRANTTYAAGDLVGSLTVASADAVLSTVVNDHVHGNYVAPAANQIANGITIGAGAFTVVGNGFLTASQTQAACAAAIAGGVVLAAFQPNIDPATSAQATSLAASLAALAAANPGTGSGSVPVDHNYGGADALRILENDSPFDDATIRAFLAADYAASNFTVQGETSTDNAGRWVAALDLDPGDYSLVVSKPGEIITKVIPLTVS